jgi:hypothetical protein
MRSTGGDWPISMAGGSCSSMLCKPLKAPAEWVCDIPITEHTTSSYSTCMLSMLRGLLRMSISLRLGPAVVHETVSSPAPHFLVSSKRFQNLSAFGPLPAHQRPPVSFFRPLHFSTSDRPSTVSDTRSLRPYLSGRVVRSPHLGPVSTANGGGCVLCGLP